MFSPCFLPLEAWAVEEGVDGIGEAGVDQDHQLGQAEGERRKEHDDGRTDHAEFEAEGRRIDERLIDDF